MTTPADARKTSPSYVCGTCGASGCKLWREYQTFAHELRCARCAATADPDQLHPVDDLDAAGTRSAPEYDWKRDRTDQIGWYVPAVPTADGYWGYTSIPYDDYAAWQALPSLPAQLTASPSADGDT